MELLMSWVIFMIMDGERNKAIELDAELKAATEKIQTLEIKKEIATKVP